MAEKEKAIQAEYDKEKDELQVIKNGLEEELGKVESRLKEEREFLKPEAIEKMKAKKIVWPWQKAKALTKKEEVPSMSREKIQKAVFEKERLIKNMREQLEKEKDLGKGEEIKTKMSQLEDELSELMRWREKLKAKEEENIELKLRKNITFRKKSEK